MIEGATDKAFNPADYPEAAYYYCVVTSTDNGCESVKIHTGVTENLNVVTHEHSDEDNDGYCDDCKCDLNSSIIPEGAFGENSILKIIFEFIYLLMSLINDLSFSI